MLWANGAIADFFSNIFPDCRKLFDNRSKKAAEQNQRDRPCFDAYDRCHEKATAGGPIYGIRDKETLDKLDRCDDKKASCLERTKLLIL